MNLINYKNLSSVELISMYILEYLGKGISLSQSDYLIINEWLQMIPDTDKLLIILNEVLQNYIQNNKKFISLKKIDKKVKNKIKYITNH